MDKHIIDQNGNHYVAPLADGQAWALPEGHTEIDPPAVPGSRWVDGEWAPPQPEPTFYPLYRSAFIARQSNEEAGILEAALQQAEPKLRQMFYAVEYFMSDDPLFAVLHWTVTLALSEARADELLAPDE